MRELTLICVGCGKSRTFWGRNVDELLEAIDKAEWQDHPNKNDGFCPECASNPDLGYED